MDLSLKPSNPPLPPRPEPQTTAPRPQPVAQPAPASLESPVNRRGFLIGFSIGGGAITCSGSFVDCGWESGAAFELHLGGMVSDRTGLMYDTSGFGLEDGGETAGLGVHTLAVQHWTSPRGWIKGGAGFASVTCSFCGEYDYGLGLMGATGVELVQHRSFVLDLQGRFLFSRFEGVNFYKPTVTLGFNWY